MLSLRVPSILWFTLLFVYFALPSQIYAQNYYNRNTYPRRYNDRGNQRLNIDDQRVTTTTEKHADSREPKIVEGSYFNQKWQNFNQRRNPFSIDDIRGQTDKSRNVEFEQSYSRRHYNYSSGRGANYGGQYSRTHDRTVVSNVGSVREPSRSTSHVTRYYNTSISQGSRFTSISNSGRHVQTPPLWYNRTWHWSSNRTRSYDADLDGTTLPPNFDTFFENTIFKYDTRHPFNPLGRTSCDAFSCHPPVGDLLIGREEKLSASSTCGLTEPQKYCILSQLKTRKKCYTCNSNERYKSDMYLYHKIENIVTREHERKDEQFWWQAENGVENVTIRLDLEAEFQFTHLIMTFQTFRPAAMIIERSDDGGHTWKVYQYFAKNCKETFPHVPLGPRQRVGDVVCESKYSDVNPSKDGEVIFSVLPQHIQQHIENPYSEEVQNVIRITNLRINFTKLHTFGDDKLDNREEIKRKYYYAIKNMVVRGSCSCYGHASRCVSDGKQVLGMVYGKCDCEHNTTGLNCEKCMDLYNDVRWQPAIGNKTHSCKKCNCNNHATRCRFDEAVFNASLGVSGGVCEDCQHNTEGKNCEFCKPFYYRDPQRSIDDPNVCQPCDCDPRGSLDDGICDNMDSETSTMIAGKCRCKDNVEGRRCDRCKRDFWNLDKFNPQGCKRCSCNRTGTVGNLGCNPVTGECLCKRNVIGKDCNECAPEHYGLGDSDEGCFACDCDLGGSYDRNCDIRTGNCSCRPNIVGRTCRKVKDNFFVPDIDYLTYEGEDGRSSAQSQIIIRERYPGQRPSWTGDGFREVFTDSFVEIDVSNIATSMDYGILVRYEPKYNQERVEAKVFIDSRGVGPYGVCRDRTNTRGNLTFYRSKVAVVSGGPFCFEKGIDYKVRIETSPTGDTASVLIDSIVLIPDINSMDLMNPAAKKEYEHYKCAQFFNEVIRPEIPEVCKKYTHSIAMQVFNGARPCDCYPMGSLSMICSQFGGRCQCKPNVAGQRCDRCAKGFYDLGPDGCKPCDCDGNGSYDNNCDEKTGQCNCKKNKYGRKCDECQPGYWNYPSCEKCRCNEHADKCDSRTGICINCRDRTTGPHCESCEPGYYGNPLFGSNSPCKPCPCPGVPGSGLWHADGCYIDQRTGSPICRCHTGYDGESCDKCANNYWGSPGIPGGNCSLCDCNNNIDILQPGNCDQRTGQCLRCIFHTEGPKCDRCIDGYYGNAIQQECRECVCNKLGTDFSLGSCNRTTGQCHCLPNVIGQECDRCQHGHWNLASGKGCQPCNCDEQGSHQTSCNLYDGQCQCLQGYGGLQCNECEPNYWGNPKEKCFPCDCNTPGSATTQCLQNGTCICLKGIAGDRCDRCARGYTGTAPHCKSCGECFENWDFIIENLRNHTLRLLETARRIKNTGTTGAYKEQFSAIEMHLWEIEQIISGASITEKDIAEVESSINELRITLTELQEKLNAYEKQIESTASRTTDAELTISELRRRVKKLELDTINLKKNMTELQAMNVGGAFNLTKDAQSRSRLAEQNVKSAIPILSQSEILRRQTEKLLEQAAEHYNKSFSDNQLAITDIQRRISLLEGEVPNVNELVCGGRSTLDECDASCGGALCQICGELSCDAAVTIAGNALEFGRKAEEALTRLQETVKRQWNSIYEAKTKADEALREAQVAYNKAMNAKTESEDTTKAIQDLLDKIEIFLDAAKAKPAEIRTLAKSCIAKDISLTPQQILELARQINETIASLTNIDKILLETADKLGTANALRLRADAAKQKADNILNTAKQVVDTLKQALEAQQKAEEAIRIATSHIENTQQDLDSISQETAAAAKVSQTAQEGIADLEKRLVELKKKNIQNELYVDKAVREAQLAGTMAKDAENGARELEIKFEDAASRLDEKANVSARIKERAESLRERARLLAENANSKLKFLQDIEDEFDENERRLKSYEKLIAELNNEMTGHLEKIETLAIYHRSCNG